MKTQARPVWSPERPTEYRRMPLLRLVEMIVQHSDSQALRELHDYRILYWSRDRTPYRLVEYINLLCDEIHAYQNSGYNEKILEMAYDLTVDKFSNIPQSSDTVPQDRHQGSDCRQYLKAFLSYVKTSLHLTGSTVRRVSDELITTDMLRKLVKRHLHLSCLESQRRISELLKRYDWKVDGHILHLWVPRSMPGHRCRKWLEENIPHVNPARTGEKARVQALIEQLLPIPRMIQISQIQTSKGKAFSDKGNLDAPMEEEVSVKGLAAVVALEKADNIHLQRPALRRLGRTKLIHLILDVFSRLAEDNYQEKQIAARFGVSNPTFSRFAGQRWKKRQHGKATTSVPDLWRNTAQTLASHSQFVEAARKAQVWKRVSLITNGGKQ